MTIKIDLSRPHTAVAPENCDYRGAVLFRASANEFW